MSIDIRSWSGEIIRIEAAQTALPMHRRRKEELVALRKRKQTQSERGPPDSRLMQTGKEKSGKEPAE